MLCTVCHTMLPPCVHPLIRSEVPLPSYAALHAALDTMRGTVCHAMLPLCVQLLIRSEAPSMCHTMLPPCVVCSHWFEARHYPVPRDAAAVRGVQTSI